MAIQDARGALCYFWDVDTLSWVKGAQPGDSSSSGGDVNVTNASLAVTGTFWQATQPISGTVTANVSDNATRDNGKIDIASLDQYTPVSGRLPVDGSGVTQPVSIAATVATKEARASSASVASVNDSATSVTLLASNANRLGCSFFNDSSSDLYLKCGTTASTTDFTVKVLAGGYFEMPYHYTGRVDGIWSSDSTGACRVTEYT